MTKEDARLAVMGAISMALKDPVLQQGFEIICKENAELKKACDETQELLDKQIEATYKLDQKNTELKEQIEKNKEQFTKAIEVIEGLMRFCRCFAQHHTEDIRYKEAEQFLSEVEK